MKDLSTYKEGYEPHFERLCFELANINADIHKSYTYYINTVLEEIALQADNGRPYTAEEIRSAKLNNAGENK